MRIILSSSVCSLIVYISCIMQHVNNILIVCFPKKYENLCRGHETPSFGISCGYIIYMAKAVLEYFVRRVVTNSLEISFQRMIVMKYFKEGLGNMRKRHDNVTGLQLISFSCFY